MRGGYNNYNSYNSYNAHNAHNDYSQTPQNEGQFDPDYHDEHRRDGPQSTWTGLRILSMAVFVIHASAAVFLAFVAGKCGASFVVDTFAETLGSRHPAGYLVVTERACGDPRNVSCFYGIPRAYDVAQRGLEWNVFALLAAFEWISASFALGHLSGNFDPAKRPPDNDVSQIKLLSLVWNLAGAIWLLVPGHSSLLQLGITGLALMVATSVQYYPVGAEDSAAVVMHYTEYCASASLLFVGVLVLYIPNPPTWAVIVGFTGMLLCNLSGVAAHMCKLYTAAGRSQLPFFDLDWAKASNHFKLYMLHSWLGLLMAVLSIVYLARDSFADADIPWWVRLILINLLVTYGLFGVWATACYALADLQVRPRPVRMQLMEEEELVDRSLDPGFARWVSCRLAFGLTVLSFAAKLPIALAVFFGLIGMPGDRVCSVF